jgi:hypothetical protein
VGIFKKRIDPLSVTMAMVQAIVTEDQAAILQASKAVQSLSPAEVFSSLGNFGQLIANGVKPEQKEIMRAELAAVDASPAVKSAVQDIGSALLVDVNPSAAGTAVGTHAKQLAGTEDWTAVIGETLYATARIVKRLDIKLNWK